MTLPDPDRDLCAGGWTRPWRRNAPFMLLFGALLAGAGAVLLLFTKSDIHLAIDAHHVGIADELFPLVTFFGDGWFVVLLVLVLLLVRYRWALLVALANIAASLVVQVLKHSWFAGESRPKEFFRGTHALHFVPGVEVFSWNSFPSGHAATAFATCFCLALFCRSRLSKAAWCCTAAVVAFSRVYLSQHFLMDIYVGAIVGTFTAAAVSAVVGGAGTAAGTRGLDSSVWKWGASLRAARREGAGDGR